MREKLPDRRKCITQRLKINGQTVHFTVGLYPDGRPGELFIDRQKIGTSEKAWCGSTAKLISLMLQYGVPLSELVDALVGNCTEPFGSVPVDGHPIITDAVGVLDAIMRSLALDYLAREKRETPCIAEFMQITKDMEAAELYELIGDDLLDSFLEKFI